MKKRNGDPSLSHFVTVHSHYELRQKTDKQHIITVSAELHLAMKLQCSAKEHSIKRFNHVCVI